MRASRENELSHRCHRVDPAMHRKSDGTEVAMRSNRRTSTMAALHARASAARNASGS
jgi:hypothetical protein